MKKLQNSNKMLTLAITLCSLFYAGLVIHYTLTGFEGRIRLTTVLVPLGLIIHCLYRGKRFYSKRGDAFNWTVFSLFLVISIISLIYLWTNYDGLIYERAGDFNTLDYIIGLLSFLVIAEIVRQGYGNTIIAIIAVFALYCLFGRWIPGFLHHGGISISRLISSVSVEMNQGIWGLLPQVGTTWITMFILLASIAESFGCLDALMNVCKIIPRYATYGVPQTAVISSLLIGGFSGSAAANVAATGAFTIPLMKRYGLPETIAGAIEAVVSTGGQVMPPIMGAGVFLMVEFLGVRYLDLILVGFAPGLLFFGATSLSVYLLSRRFITPTTVVNTGEFKVTARDIINIIPVIAAVTMLMIMLGVFLSGIMISGFLAIVALLVAQAILAGGQALKGDPQNLKRYPRQLLEGIRSGVKGSVSLVLLLSLMGTIVAVLNVSGFTLKITTTLTEAAGGNFVALFLLVTLVCVVFGMGVPTVAAYLMVAIMAAPALSEFGIAPMVAHFFVFYIAILSGLTPPVALNAAVACRISGASFWQTAGQSLKIGFPLFLLPIFFLYRPAILSGSYSAISAALIIGLGLASIIFAIYGLGRTFATYVRRVALFGLGGIVLFHVQGDALFWFAACGAAALIAFEVWQLRIPEHDMVLA